MTERNTNGWRRDKPDDRDLWVPRTLAAATYPDVFIDLKGLCEVYDQGNLGSCTANAGAGVAQIREVLQNKPTKALVPSRLFIYYNERAKHGEEKSDSGAELRDAAKVGAKLGYCYESGDHSYPYQIKHFKDKPPQDCYDFALNHKYQAYTRVQQDEMAIKEQIFAKNPVMFGFDYPVTFDHVKKDGILELSNKFSGGHAVVIVGWSNQVKGTDLYFLIRNSYGKDWGWEGHVWIPAEFVLGKHSSDFWAISEVSFQTS